MRPRLDSRESSVTQGEILNDDEDYSLEKVEDFQLVLSRRYKQIKELKVKLGKRERGRSIGLEDEKYKILKCCYEFECQVKALNASLNWWEGKDTEQRCAAVQLERKKARGYGNREECDKVRQDLEKH